MPHDWWRNERSSFAKKSLGAIFRAGKHQSTRSRTFYPRDLFIVSPISIRLAKGNSYLIKSFYVVTPHGCLRSRHCLMSTKRWLPRDKSAVCDLPVVCREALLKINIKFSYLYVDDVLCPFKGSPHDLNNFLALINSVMKQKLIIKFPFQIY